MADGGRGGAFFDVARSDDAAETILVGDGPGVAAHPQQKLVGVGQSEVGGEGSRSGLHDLGDADAFEFAAGFAGGARKTPS